MSQPKESDEQIRGTDWSVYFIPIAISALLIAAFFPFVKGFLRSVRSTPESDRKGSSQGAVRMETNSVVKVEPDRDALFHKMAKEGKSANQISQELDISFRGVIEKMKRHGYISKAEYESLRKTS